MKGLKHKTPASTIKQKGSSQNTKSSTLSLRYFQWLYTLILSIVICNLFSKSSLKNNLFHPSLFETRKKHTSDRVFSILNIIQRYILQQKSSQVQGSASCNTTRQHVYLRKHCHNMGYNINIATIWIADKFCNSLWLLFSIQFNIYRYDISNDNFLFSKRTVPKIFPKGLILAS